MPVKGHVAGSWNTQCIDLDGCERFLIQQFDFFRQHEPQTFANPTAMP